MTICLLCVNYCGRCRGNAVKGIFDVADRKIITSHAYPTICECVCVGLWVVKPCGLGSRH